MGRSRISTSYTKHTNLIYKMATIVVLGGTIKADKKADFVAYCKEAVANCKAANGCEWAKGCIDTEDNSKFAIFQKWTDDGARKAFAEKVKSEGKLANAVSTMLEAGTYKKRVFRVSEIHWNQ